MKEEGRSTDVGGTRVVVEHRGSSSESPRRTWISALFSNTTLRREARNPDEFGDSRAKELGVKRNSHPELRAPGPAAMVIISDQGGFGKSTRVSRQRRVRSRWLFYRGDRGVPAASHPPSRRAMPDPCILPEGRTSPEADRHNSPWVSPTPEAKAAPAGGEVHNCVPTRDAELLAGRPRETLTSAAGLIGTQTGQSRPSSAARKAPSRLRLQQTANGS